jgi:hypothetical protein
LGALAYAVDEADEFFLAFRRCADDDQQTLRLALKAGLHVDAIDPEVYVMFGGQIAPTPARMLLKPRLLETGDRRSRQPAGILAKQRRQRLIEIACGDALEVEDRNQHLQTL